MRHEEHATEIHDAITRQLTPSQKLPSFTSFGAETSFFVPSREMQGEPDSLITLFVAPLNRPSVKYMVTRSSATSI